MRGSRRKSRRGFTVVRHRVVGAKLLEGIKSHEVKLGGQRKLVVWSSHAIQIDIVVISSSPRLHTSEGSAA